MLTIKDVKLGKKNILLMVDYNVRIIENEIVSAFKIKKTFQTIEYILKENIGGKLTICSHLGRPNNKKECSLKLIYKYLANVFVDLKYIEISKILSKSDLLSDFNLADNIRYYSRDELKEFYNLFDIRINDAFGTAHRENDFESYAGILMSREIAALKNWRSCDLVIMGGAKVDDKLKILKSFRKNIFVGGCLAHLIYNEIGYKMGEYAKHDIEEIKNDLEIIGNEKENYMGNTMKRKIYLPCDFLVIEKDNENNKYTIKRYDQIDKNDECIDIGPKTIEWVREAVNKSNMIFWNGPVGKMEDVNAIGTKNLVNVLKEFGNKVICGGGETLIAVEKYGAEIILKHVSTGGGSLLQMISGGRLPGIEKIFKNK